MASFYAKVRGAARQVPSYTAKLQGVFDALDDGELLRALRGKRHRGCQGYSVEALWHSYLASYILNIPTVAALVRFLTNHPSLAIACGLNPNAIPSEATYSRLVARLARRQGLVRSIMRSAIEVLKQNLPDFGKVVAIDSSEIVAYSQSRKPSDPDARWAKKRNKHGRDHWWFGYKVHVSVCARHELPIHLEVTPANVNDSIMLPTVLRRSRVQPSVILADAGYDATENYRFVVGELKAIPIIKLNPRGAKTLDRVPHRSKDFTMAHGLRKFAGIDRLSQEWQVKYDMRVSSERVLSRAKEFRRLGSVHHRGLAKVTLHCYLSMLSMAASAVSSFSLQQSLRMVA